MLHFLLGLFIGGILGAFLMAAACASGNADERNGAK